MGGNTIRDAIAVALEGLTGDVFEWVILEPKAMRDHVILWVHQYARARGVILNDKDIKDELVAIIRDLKKGKRPNE